MDNREIKEYFEKDYKNISGISIGDLISLYKKISPLPCLDYQKEQYDDSISVPKLSKKKAAIAGDCIDHITSSPCKN